MTRVIRPKSWSDFQHYKDRSPPWIKLHKRLLDNYEFFTLPVASRALAPMLWLIASEHEDGHIDAGDRKLAFRLRMTAAELNEALDPLVSAGFFEVLHDDSAMLAEREREAIPERESETQGETQVKAEGDARKARRSPKLKTSIPDNFPGDEERRRAQEAWMKIGRPDLSASVLDEIEKFRDHHTSQAKPSADWPASWRTWIKNAPRFTPQERANGRRTGKPLDDTWRGIAAFAEQDSQVAGSDTYRGTESSTAGVAPRQVTSGPNGATDHESRAGETAGSAGDRLRLATIGRG